jgi:hypothetical protein
MKPVVLALAAATFWGCRDSEPVQRESIGLEGAGAVAGRTDAAVPDPLPPVSANPVLWDVERVAEALKEIGLEMEGVAAPVDATCLSARGNRMTFVAPGGARAEIRVFIYGDAGAVGRDLAGVDTVRVAPRGTSLEWRVPARLVTDNNLVAILLTDDAALRDTIRKVLTQVD